MNPRTKFFRGLAMVAALGVGLSACKEELVLPPASPTISISPSGTIELRPGETAQVTATVTGLSDNSVTYSSSNAAVATVNSTTGAVTAVAEGAATITARATADANLQASVLVRVEAQQLPPTEEAEVSIQSVTQTQTNIPVDPDNVRGIIDVTVSVERGAATALEFFVGNDQITSCRQTFGAASEAADITAEDLRLGANQSSVICSINTEQFTVNADSIGVVRFLNGQYQFRAQLVENGTVLDAATSGTHTFNNEDFVVVRLAGENSAISDDNLLLWHGGTVTATAIPVVFEGVDENGQGPAQVTQVVFDYDGGFRTRTDSEAPFIQEFRTTGASNINNITDPNFVIDVVTVRTNGQPGPSDDSDNWLPNGVTAFRYDSEAPDADFFIQDQRLTPLAAQSVRLCCNNDWVGTTYDFDLGIDNESDFGGVGIEAITYHVGDPGDDPEDIAETDALPTGTGADLEETATNADYQIVAVIRDKLGNSAILEKQGTAANPGTAIGVDKTNPAIAFAAGSVDDMQIFNLSTGAPGGAFQVAVTDTAVGGAAPSGFGPLPVVARVARWFPGLTANQQCLVPGLFAASQCRLQGDDTVEPVPVDDGFYTYAAVAVDQAGNTSTPLSAPLTRIVLNDQDAPTASNIAIPAVLDGGTPTTFTATATDNLHLWRAEFRFEFGAVETLPFSDRQTFASRFVGAQSELLTSASASTTVPFVRALEQVDGADAPAGALQEATAITLRVEDAAGNDDTQLNLFAAGTVEAGVSFNTRGVNTFSVAAPDAAVDVWNGTDGQPAGGTPTSRTITAQATGASSTFANPFPLGVTFYFEDADGVIQRLATVTGPSVTDDGVIRTWSWNFNFNALGLPADANVRIFAVGLHSDGDALQSADNLNLSIVDGI